MTGSEMKRRLSILDSVRIASPCDVGWANMRGDDKDRYCDRCQKNVYNLSGMTRTEAKNLLREKEGRLCVSIFRRLDGTILTADCPIGLRAVRRGLLKTIGAVAAIVAVVVSGLSFLDPTVQGRI